MDRRGFLGRQTKLYVVDPSGICLVFPCSAGACKGLVCLPKTLNEETSVHPHVSSLRGVLPAPPLRPTPDSRPLAGPEDLPGRRGSLPRGMTGSGRVSSGTMGLWGCARSPPSTEAREVEGEDRLEDVLTHQGSLRFPERNCKCLGQRLLYVLRRRTSVARRSGRVSSTSHFALHPLHLTNIGVGVAVTTPWDNLREEEGPRTTGRDVTPTTTTVDVSRQRSYITPVSVLSHYI